MSIFTNKNRIVSASLLLIALIFAAAAGAQTTRKSKTKTGAKTSATPKPLATPLPTVTGAEIISRADDFSTLPPVVQPTDNTGPKPNATNAARIKELNERINKLEGGGSKSDYDDKQKRLLLNLDILTRAEQRSETLRKQLFEMIERENSVKSRLDQIEFDIRPEMIERTLQIAGSMRPEEVRESRKKSLIAERTNLQSLLTQIQSNRANVEATLSKSDVMVEKLRTKLEKDIDDSFLKDDPEN